MNGIKKRQMNLGEPLQDSGVVGIDFDLLRHEKPSLYQIVSIDLSVARTNELLEVVGTFLGVSNLTSGASLDIAFNMQLAKPFTFDSEQVIELPFYQIFLTNTAQPAGATCDLHILIAGRYIPYYRTKAVSPIVNNSPTIAPVTVGVTAVLISASNILRRQVFIQSVLTNTDIIYLGKDATVTTATGFPLYMGGQNQFLSPYYTGDIYGISGTAGQEIRVWTNFE